MPISSGRALCAGGTPDLDRLESAFRSASPLFRDVVSRLRRDLGADWAQGADETIRRLFPTEEDLIAAVKGYSRFALNILRLQARFEKTRAYQAKPYDQVCRDVYANGEFMRTQYLPGLLLSHELWPHHVRQRRFFESAFLSEMGRGGARTFYDVGIGTGFYSRLALVGLPAAVGVGYEISEESKAFSERQATAFGVGERLHVEIRNVVETPPEPIGWLLCVEVLEHLEDPVAFLRGLRSILAPGGKAFVTTALNAPHDDHIFLYRTAAEVCDQFLEVGFEIEGYFCSPAGKPAFRGAPVPEVAAFVVV